MERKEYTEPVMELVEMESEDIIVTSAWEPDNDVPNPFN